MVTGRLALLVWLACGLARSAEKSAFGPVVIGLPPGAKTETVQDQLVQRLKDLLKQTSQVLYKATGLYFEEIIFLVPSSWETSKSWQYDYVGKPPKADIVVTTNSNSVFGNGPYALQFGPCGSKGLRINVPETFLLSKDTKNSLDKAKQLSREWIKYRYGVFDEHGFAGDIRYPLYSAVLGSEQIEVTDCTDEPVQYMFRDRYDRDCPADVDIKTGLPNSECYPRFETNSNDNVTSSLMYSHMLRNVEYLCGDGRHPHKNLAPNKQNVLCNGRSIKEVLAESNDFKTQRIEEDSSLAPDVTFRFSKESGNRIVVALDASTELAKYKDIIRNAIANLIYSLPSGSEFGITVAADEGMHTIFGNEDLNDRNNLILKTKTVYQGQSCPECSIRKAIEIITSNNGGKYGSIVLLSPANLGMVGSGLVDEVKSSGACLTVVLFPGATSSSYEDVFGGSLCGSVVAVPDDISFSTLRVLYEALERPIKAEHSKIIKLKATEISSNSKNEFVVDSAMTRIDVWLSNKSSEMEIAQNNIRIYPVNGAEPQMQMITSVDSFIVLRIANPLAGLWTCSLEYGSPLFMKITATLKANEPLQTESWFLDTTTEGTDVQMPVILYVAVMKGIHPIINALVKAEIKTPDKDSVVFNLRDNGLGDPDITKNDGVYSRYFVNFATTGEYETTIFISNKEGNATVIKPDPQGPAKPCCGSKVLSGQMERVEPFYREVKLYFTTSGKYPERGYSPSTIQDLQVTAVANDLFNLRWTAPGGIKDHGKVAKYMLKQYQNYEDLIHDREIKVNGFQYNDTITPKNYGETEEMELLVTDDTTLNASYILTLITWNENDVKSSRSNAVKVFLDPDLKSKTLEPKSTSPTIDENGNSVKHGQLSKETIGYIIGAVLALLLIICGYIAFYCCMKRRQKKEEAEEKTARKERHTNNNNNDGSVTADEWKLGGSNHISPVNSVPASVLLYHHEQVKEAKRKNREPPLFKLEHIKDTEEKLSHSSMQSLPTSHVSEGPTTTTVDIEYTGRDRPSHPSPRFKDSPPKPGLLVTDV